MLCIRIHQVRSDGNNIAVNVWWKHHLNFDVDIDRCDSVSDSVSDSDVGVDQSLTLDKVSIHSDRSHSDVTPSLRYSS